MIHEGRIDYKNISEIATMTYYSYVPNKRGVPNKHGGWTISDN